jgi:hypothetical protein
MAQTGYTPIQLYYSSTTTNAPLAANLANGELAINITDGKLFYKDNANAVQVIGWKITPTTAGGTGLTSYTAGDTVYYASGTAFSKLPIGSSGTYMSSTGSAPQWSAPAALTKTDDTNVTLTLGGNASTALLNAASLTLGWTGQLSTSRGGTGLSSFTSGGVVYASSASVLATGSALSFDGTNFATTGTASATKFIPTGGSATGNGMYLPASNNVAFSTNGTEGFRLDSSQNLLVGATSGTTFGGVSTTNRVNISANLSWIFAISNSVASGSIFGQSIKYINQAPNDGSNGFFHCYDNVGVRFYVSSNGGVNNYSANNTNLSDRREKTNFAPAKSYLDVICSIPVQTFNYIDQNMIEDDGLTLGVVAQDVQAVAPELVKETNWGSEDEPKLRLSIYQTDLQYALMKSIQELKAEFDAYKASHP